MEHDTSMHPEKLGADSTWRARARQPSHLWHLAKGLVSDRLTVPRTSSGFSGSSIDADHHSKLAAWTDCYSTSATLEAWRAVATSAPPATPTS